MIRPSARDLDPRSARAGDPRLRAESPNTISFNPPRHSWRHRRDTMPSRDQRADGSTTRCGCEYRLLFSESQATLVRLDSATSRSPSWTGCATRLADLRRARALSLQTRRLLRTAIVWPKGKETIARTITMETLRRPPLHSRGLKGAGISPTSPAGTTCPRGVLLPARLRAMRAAEDLGRPTGAASHTRDLYVMTRGHHPTLSTFSRTAGSPIAGGRTYVGATRRAPTAPQIELRTDGTVTTAGCIR